MKKVLLALAVLCRGCELAPAQPHIVAISPPYQLLGRTYVTVFATQLANHSVTIEAAVEHNFKNTFTGAGYACYPERQVVVASFATDFFYDLETGFFVFDPPQMFFRARNSPCSPGEAAAAFFANPFGLPP